MSRHRIRIVQVYRVERAIEIDVEADDLDWAIERMASGDEDMPHHDDPRWLSGWDLQNEDVIAV